MAAEREAETQGFDQIPLRQEQVEWSGGPGTLARTSWAELGKTQLRGRLRKDAQGESCKLSFIWGKMRTAAWETAAQRPLRGCSKEVMGKDR